MHLLDLAAHAVKPVLHKEDVIDRVRLAKQLQVATLRRLQGAQAGLEVRELLGDVVGLGAFLRHLAHAPDLAEHVLVAVSRHANREVGDLLIFHVGERGAGDEAAGGLSDADDILEVAPDLGHFHVYRGALDDLAVQHVLDFRGGRLAGWRSDVRPGHLAGRGDFGGGVIPSPHCRWFVFAAGDSEDEERGDGAQEDDAGSVQHGGTSLRLCC